ncbi:hypothetical protein FSP39_003421 [Pinctada imbricata]|uniref:Secreted frizzled-related protein 5 n=1 Tax=Pinctada imbricata TaxID=66713 RepID=A0AA88YAB3_PINIB|nr:hypothetical protein FSP39_003421 [Pinctada imbricata]
MRLPNLLEHDSIHEVLQQAQSWISLLRVQCHPDTQLFLCSLFSPVCLDRPVYPCRSLCEAVKAGCEQTMMFYGYLWPPMVKCDQFPLDDELCIPALHNATNRYSQMRLPNLLEHDSIHEVLQQAQSWISLLRVQCHPDTQLFLCSLFSPVCLDRPVYPCRSLCEAVKAGCEQTMMFYGYLWPPMVKCDQFPDTDLCIHALHNVTKTQNICSACRQPDSYEGLIHNYCRAGYIIRGKIRKLVSSSNDNTILYLKKKKKVIKKTMLLNKDKKRLRPYIPGGVHCECDRINITKGEKYLIMGNRTAAGDYTVTFVGVWNRRSRYFRNAIKAMRKGIDCTNIIQHSQEATSSGGSRGKGSKGRKKKKGKKGKKNKKKKGKKKNRKGKKGKRKGKGKGKGRKRKNG